LDFDGFSELWFDDLPSMQAAFAAEKQVKDLVEDEARLIGDLKLVTAIQHVVIAKPAGARLIKRMSTLKRRPDVSAEKFAEEWFDVHSVLVKQLPQVKAYTQNLIFDRSHGRGKPATYAELPIDGIVELWFGGGAHEPAHQTAAGRFAASRHRSQDPRDAPARWTAVYDYAGQLAHQRSNHPWQGAKVWRNDLGGG
jgi:hypothetical protein